MLTLLNSSQATSNYNLEWSECRSKLHTRHPYAGEFEGAAICARRVPRRFSKSRERPASQRGVWGSEPPDPGSVHTSETRNPQILYVYRSTCY